MSHASISPFPPILPDPLQPPVPPINVPREPDIVLPGPTIDPPPTMPPVTGPADQRR